MPRKSKSLEKNRKIAKTRTDGRFYREIGKKENGKAPRFYFGHDEVMAGVLNQRLEETWNAVKELWKRNYENQEGNDISPFPCWDSTTLKIAQAIVKNETVVYLEKPDWCADDDEFPLIWINDLQKFFKLIKLQLANQKLEEQGVRLLTEGYNRERADLENKYRNELEDLKGFYSRCGPVVGSQETLHEALKAYKKWIEEEHYIDIDGKTTQAGIKQGDRVARIIRIYKDLPLSDFDAVGVEELVRFWSKRPVKPNGDRYSYSVCKNTIWLIRNFIKWLNKSKGFVWKKPADLDIDGIKILRDNKIKTKVDVYSINEIKVIWDFCTKFESQLILLALNCGFSIQEIGLLDWAEIEDGYIKGIRPKSKVYGEFKLWDITKEVLGEPKKDGLVFLNKNGRGLYETTKGNNVSAAIPNAWNRLIKRIQKVHPGFRRLSFHKLRKTAGDFIRKKSDGETASVFLRHGHPVPEDKLLEIYTNPVFEKVFAAQDAVFEEFKGFLIPKKDDVIPRKLTPEQVVELKKEIKWGKKTSWLAKKYSVSATTIREYRKIATK